VVGRVRKEPVPDRVPYGRSRAKGAGAGSRALWSVACGIACRRIACRMARRRIASRCVPARVGDLDVPAVFPVGRTEGPLSAMSRPNSACNRRRHRRFTNVYSLVMPWRFSMAPSAARLRRTVGPLSPRNAGAELSGQPGSRAEQTQRSDRIPRRRPPERENTVSSVNSSHITERNMFRTEKIRYRV